MWPDSAIFSAFVATAKGEPQRAIKLLEPALAREIGNNLKSTAFRARALAFEALGQFRPAYNSFSQMNEVGLAANAARADIAKHYLDRAAYNIGELPPDDRRSTHIMMVAHATARRRCSVLGGISSAPVANFGQYHIPSLGKARRMPNMATAL
ncbi:MAG: hypothetical protein HOP13_03370 [Alphaproteobacteria bacterium]|nr:hypothetical protein [Alphaproteobacteria bacterium]